MDRDVLVDELTLAWREHDRVATNAPRGRPPPAGWLQHENRRLHAALTALGLTYQTIGPLVTAARQPPPRGHGASLEDAIAGAIHHHQNLKESA